MAKEGLMMHTKLATNLEVCVKDLLEAADEFAKNGLPKEATAAIDRAEVLTMRLEWLVRGEKL